jgi:hypothetical protein
MKKLFTWQTILLLAGTLFAGYNVVKNFITFYGFEGTIFKIQDCVIPNPVTQACFYGAVGFLIALIWSISLLQKPTNTKQHYLWWFLSAGTIFAWYNVTKEFILFYSTRSGPALGCSATPITNPFLTPCFTGATIFLITAILAGLIYSRMSKSSKDNENI